jgi:hypothetical protein
LRVLQNSSCNHCQSDRENLWPLVFLIVPGSKLELCNIFWCQKSHFLINWLLVIGVLIGVRVQGSNFNLSIKVNSAVPLENSGVFTYLNCLNFRLSYQFTYFIWTYFMKAFQSLKKK